MFIQEKMTGDHATSHLLVDMNCLEKLSKLEVSTEVNEFKMVRDSKSDKNFQGVSLWSFKRKVTKFKVSDICGVGCFIDACLNCVNCEKGDEQYCLNGMTGTYNGIKKHGRVGGNQETRTAGGY